MPAPDARDAHDALPRWLPLAARVNALLSGPACRSGARRSSRSSGAGPAGRSTPVSLVVLDGERFVVSGEGIAWVANARAAGWGDVERGRRRERVRLVELASTDRRPVLRAFWHQVPHGRPFIARLFGLAPDATADDFEAAAPRCPVFRLDPIA